MLEISLHAPRNRHPLAIARPVGSDAPVLIRELRQATGTAGRLRRGDVAPLLLHLQPGGIPLWVATLDCGAGAHGAASPPSPPGTGGSPASSSSITSACRTSRTCRRSGSSRACTPRRALPTPALPRRCVR